MTPTRSRDSGDDDGPFPPSPFPPHFFAGPNGNGYASGFSGFSGYASGRLSSDSQDRSDSHESGGGLSFDSGDEHQSDGRRISVSPPKSPPKVPRAERDRLSGSTLAVGPDEMPKDEVVDDVDLFSDEEKAKVDRKIADLEISNASLLAINRTLEATKAKQRSEIVKLRRMLRETNTLGPTTSLVRASASAAASSHHTRAATIPQSPLARVTSDDDAGADDGPSGVWGDDEMDDPELEARWERLTDLVGAMRRQGERAVERTKEDAKPGVQRVLGWLEVEALGGEAGSSVTGSQSNLNLVSAAGSEMGDTPGESVVAEQPSSQ